MKLNEKSAENTKTKLKGGMNLLCSQSGVLLYVPLLKCFLKFLFTGNPVHVGFFL